jgi:CheY-like chemotaxis protein
MEPIALTVAAVAFVGSCVAQKCTDAALDAAWARISTAFQRWRGSEPTVQEVEAAVTEGNVDPALVNEAKNIFDLSSALRRARQVSQVLDGAHLLWIDDCPENNTWERELLSAFGCEVTNVESTRSALACLAQRSYDVILSDIDREGRPDEGVRILPDIASRSSGAPIVFYVGRLSNDTRPSGAFGITNHPNELLHLLLDSLERSRL